MKKIWIQHNPYIIETNITINGAAPASNSAIPQLTAKGIRLHDWIDELPGIILEETNDSQLNVKFHGTRSDYDDVYDAFHEHSELQVEFEHIPGEEPDDKGALIRELFKIMQDGPFPEMKNDTLEKLFEQTMNDAFEVCVAAPISAGKSTLINALLHKKLMPSMTNACTAIITRLTDSPAAGENWNIKAYDKDKNPVSTLKNVTLNEMRSLNKREDVSIVEAEGPIPLARDMGTTLVLIDTPGPNNARNKDHETTLYRYLGDFPKSLVLYVLTSPLEARDNDELLRKIADTMKVGGRKATERFIFVLNKMDSWSMEDDGGLENARIRASEFLKHYGIAKPSIFLASAQTALDIYRARDNYESEDLENEKSKVERRKLEKFGTLTSRLQKEIDEQVERARASNDTDTKALLHSGLPSVEAAMRRYVQKYAKVTKIADFGETLGGILEESRYFENTKKRVSEHSEAFKDICGRIADIKSRLDTIVKGEKFTDTVASNMNEVKTGIGLFMDAIESRYQTRLREKMQSYKKQEFSPAEAEEIKKELTNFTRQLSAQLQVEIEEHFNKSISQIGKALAKEYKTILQTLNDELELDSAFNDSFSPLKLINGSVNVSLERIVQTKDVQIGFRPNENKRWWKFWTWFEPSYLPVYGKKEYITGSDLVQTLSTPIQKWLLDNVDNSKKYLDEQCAHIYLEFDNEFHKLNEMAKRKLADLSACATDRDRAQKNLASAKANLQWLENVEKRLEHILAI